MSMSLFRLAAFGSALLLLAGCISVGGDRPSPGAGSSSQVGLRTAGYVPAAVSLGAETGTQVGRRVRQLQGELEQLQRSLSDHYTVLQTIRDDSVRIAQEYFGTVAAINARLQVGTTPGNPILISQWSEAHVQLEALSSDVTRLNNLAGQVAADSSLATFLLQNLRSTYALSGAVEEDHRQLGVLEDEINRTVVLIDRLLNELANDVNRQTSYLATERANLQTLQLGITNGQLYGGNLSNRVSGGGPAPLAAPPRPVTPVNIGPRPNSGRWW